MKPALLPERITRPFGGSRSNSSSACASSRSASADSVLVDSPALSKISQARPPGSRSMRQCLSSVMSLSLRKYAVARRAQMADDGRPRVIIHMQGEAGAVMA